MFLDFCREEIPFWIPFNGVNIPKQAVKAGIDGAQKLYIGRAHHSGSVTPGKIPENDKLCFIPWGTIANIKDDYEILISPSEANWVAAENGAVPTNAFPGGSSKQGETLYIGRVKHEGTVTVGKVQPSHGVCYIAFGDKELNFDKYEVLVV